MTPENQLTSSDHARLVDFLKELRAISSDDERNAATSAWCDAHVQALIFGTTPPSPTHELTPPERRALREWLQRWRDEEDNLPGLREWCAERFAELTADTARAKIAHRRRRGTGWHTRLAAATGLRRR